jgi:hypothetical protein
MAPRKQTLPFGFTALAPVRVSDERWENIQTRCGFDIPSALRGAVVTKTQTMCWLSEAWQAALPIRETVKEISAIKRATADWLRRIDGLPLEVAGIIMSEDHSEQADLVIKPFMKFLAASCDERLTELASIDTQDARHPWETWITEVTDLFKQHDLPTGARKALSLRDLRS